MVSVVIFPPLDVLEEDVDEMALDTDEAEDEETTAVLEVGVDVVVLVVVDLLVARKAPATTIIRMMTTTTAIIALPIPILCEATDCIEALRKLGGIKS